MFSHYKAVGLPGGPLLTPSTVFRTPGGKLHLNSTCKQALEPEQVVLWGVDEEQFCSRCSEEDGMPHYKWRRQLDRLFHRWQDLLTLEGNLTYDEALLGRDHFNRGGFVTWVADLIYQTSELGASDREANMSPALASWHDDILLPAEQAAYDKVVTVLPMFGAPDWHLRYAAADFAGYVAQEGIDTRAVARREPLGLSPSVYADLRDGLLWQWFKTAGTPDRDELAASARNYIRTESWASGQLDHLAQLPRHQGVAAPIPSPGQSLDEYLDDIWRGECLKEVERASYAAADELIGRYVNAQNSPPVLFCWSEASGYSMRWRARSMVGALMSTASQSYPFAGSDDALVVAPQVLIDMFTSTRRRAGAYGDAPAIGFSYGLVEQSDTPEIFNIARLLHRDDPDTYPADQALLAARMAHRKIT